MSRLVRLVALTLAGVAAIGYISEHSAHTATAASPSAVVAAGSIQAQALAVFGPGYPCAANIITRESGWNVHATNPGPGHAYGLPQALPAEKMAAAGPDWRDNPATQLRWMKTYVDTRYGGACPAWAWWQIHNWY